MPLPPTSGQPRVVCDLCFSPTVNPCCYYPCQHKGICVRFGLDRYQCDCTRTGYSGPNCTIRELGLQPHSFCPGPFLLPWACPPRHPPYFLPLSLVIALFFSCLALTSVSLPDLAPAQAVTPGTPHSLLLGSAASHCPT